MKTIRFTKTTTITAAVVLAMTASLVLATTAPAAFASEWNPNPEDTTAPDVQITKAVDKKGVEIGDSSTTKSQYIEITFGATDDVGIDNIQCSLDGKAFTSCTSPVVYDKVKTGSHQVTVRSTDTAGNIGEDQFTWTVSNPSAAAPGRA